MKFNIRTALGMCAFLALTAGVMACGEKRDNEGDTEEYEAPELPTYNMDDTTRLSPIRESNSISMNGHNYSYTIQRTPLDSVVVVDEDGFKAFDNAILLTILRDGQPFFERRYVRSSFRINIEEKFYKQCILLGMNFDRVTDYGLRFVTSLGRESDSESKKPYALTVGPDGSTNITEHQLYDEEDVPRFEED